MDVEASGGRATLFNHVRLRLLEEANSIKTSQRCFFLSCFPLSVKSWKLLIKTLNN